MSAEGMLRYLNDFGILACNENPHLPCLNTLGFTWADAVALIDRQQVFVCKLYRKRTVYLSAEVYFLLKQCRIPRPMTGDANVLYEVLSAVPMESGDLKRLVLMEKKAYDKALSFLLEEGYITAVRNGTWKLSNWSCYVYGPAVVWEKLAEKPAVCHDPETRLHTILGKTMSEKEVAKLLQSA